MLAAPDINLDVAMMRTSTEFFPSGMQRLTLYTSPGDKAMGISEFLFGGGLRVGSLDISGQAGSIGDFATREMPENVSVVEYIGKLGGAFGHDYFRTNPAVASDLVLTVRYDRDPGAEHGRPLRHVKGGFWTINDDYPAK